MTDFEKLVEQYTRQLMEYHKKHPQPENTPATPFTEPQQPVEMPVILPGEPMESPQAPISEPPPLPPIQSEGEEYISAELSDIPAVEDEGYLQVRAFTADKALPVEGALVTVTANEGVLAATSLTDEDGLTDVITLKAVPSVPTDFEEVTSLDTCTVEVVKDGFLPFKSEGVPIFSGITNLVSAQLIPLPELE